MGYSAGRPDQAVERDFSASPCDGRGVGARGRYPTCGVVRTARGSGPRVATGYGPVDSELPGLGDPVAARRGAHELCIASDLQSGEGVGHRSLGTAECLADLGGSEVLARAASQVRPHERAQLATGEPVGRANGTVGCGVVGTVVRRVIGRGRHGAPSVRHPSATVAPPGSRRAVPATSRVARCLAAVDWPIPSTSASSAAVSRGWAARASRIVSGETFCVVAMVGSFSVELLLPRRC